MILLGSAFHQSVIAERFQFTLFSFWGVWLLAAVAFSLYAAVSGRSNQLWPVPVAMLFATLLGGALRAAWLGSALIPIFVFVTAATLTLALLVWGGLDILPSTRAVRA